MSNYPHNNELCQNCLKNNPSVPNNGTYLRPPHTKTLSCQRKLASRIGLRSMLFQTLLLPGVQRNS
jgi:hypothetical protein